MPTRPGSASHEGVAFEWHLRCILIHFDIRHDEEGWTVYDSLTDEPAIVEGFASTALSRHDAEKIADLLNTLALIRPEPARTQH